MSRAFRFAIQTGPFTDPVALVEFAQRVESLGYDELFSYDHIAAAGEQLIDPFIPLVVAAGATERLRVGPLVLNNELHHPALLARTAISADQMTQGRLILGMGTGYAQAEHDAIGIALRKPAARVSRFGESLHVLRQLIDHGSCSFDGDHHVIEVEQLGLRPTQDHLPFLIGGHGRRVVSLAGAFADIFQFTGLEHAGDGTISPGGFALADLRQRSDWLEAAAGDRHGVIERSALVQYTAIDEAAEQLDMHELAERFDLSVDALAETPFVLVGSTEQIVDKIERVREELGITHYVVRDPEGFAPVVEALAGR